MSSFRGLRTLQTSRGRQLLRRKPSLSGAGTLRFCADHAAPSAESKTPAKPTSQPADHRTLGLQQQLWTHSIYSPGTPIFLPAGTRIFNRLVEFLRSQYVRYGFDEVITPTIYKKSLWARSGHLENYADNMYTVTGTKAADKEATPDALEEEDEFGLKPMNCPGHCLIFASQRWSYRDLPVRYADFSPLHRNEVTGALSGLTRVRRFHQDDGHIFCRPNQITDEIAKSLQFLREVYSILHLGEFKLLLSTRPASKYIGTVVEWDQAETALKRALDEFGQPWIINEGDGAFYGPKIDIVIKGSDGREHQTATIQLDFQMPARFSLEYQAPAPDLERRGETTTDPDLLAEYGPVRPVMIHRAILGSLERLMALLVEKYGVAKWPFWLNPRQVIILTVNNRDEVISWSKQAADILRDISPQHALANRGDSVMRSSVVVDRVNPTQIRVDIDDSARPLQAKIRAAKERGYAVVAVVGPKNVRDGTLTVNAAAIQEEMIQDGMTQMPMTPTELLKGLKRRVALYT
jgi:threonyl-tRNA synthetase